MRSLKLILLGLVAVVGTGCQTDDGGVQITAIPPLAYVRYINAVPDSLHLDSTFVRIIPTTGLPDTTYYTTSHSTTLRWMDRVDYSPQTFTAVTFAEAGLGGYQGLAVGARRFKIFTHSPTFFGTRERADTTFTFEAGKYYTILHIRPGGTGQQVRIFEDVLPSASTTTVNVRALHAAPGVGAVDVYATPSATTALTGLTPIATNVSLLAATPYVAVAPTATLAAQITSTGTTTRLAGAAVPAGGVLSSGLEASAGSSAAGSVLTGIAFPAAPAVTAPNGKVLRAAIAAQIRWFQDRRPPVVP